jgi:signal transduction histidine kinase
MVDPLQANVDAVAGLSTVPTILDVVCRTTGMGFAVIARVTEARWIACAVKDEMAFGLKACDELKVETTICTEIQQGRSAVVIDNVSHDPVYRDHPTPRMYSFKSYISMPILLADGSVFGTLCAIDPEPREVNTPAIIDMFRMFSDVIAGHIDSSDRLAVSEATLKTERGDSELREQFIAVLGHDLRNPLANIMAGTQLLRKRGLDARHEEILRLMVGSVDRMSLMIDNVLDFARGRLGGGLGVGYVNGPLKLALTQVLDELRSADTSRPFDAELDFADHVTCDPGRICQLFSNLVGNAMTHGAPRTPITIRASDANGRFTLSVANAGKPIPEAARLKLFEPFFRVALGPTKQGLGLGLYISAEIARAHGGTLTVTSDATQTRFTLSFPLIQATLPSPSDSAPYFAALVASSWTASEMTRAVPGTSVVSGPTS